MTDGHSVTSSEVLLFFPACGRERREGPLVFLGFVGDFKKRKILIEDSRR